MGVLTKEQVTEFLEKSENKEFVIRTKEEDATFEKNILENGVTEKIGEKVSEIHSRYDQDVETITGLKKEPQQKTYDFVKQVLTTYVTKAAQLDELSDKYKELEKSKGKGDDNLAKELEQIKDAARLAKDEAEKKILELTNQGLSKEKGFGIDKAIAGLKFNENIPEAVRNSYITNVRTKMIEDSELREGQLVFLKDGKPELDKEYNIKTADSIAVERLSDILAKDKKGLGLGKDKQDPQTVQVPDHVKDPDGLISWMKTIPGLEMHSEKWNEMYKELSKGL